MVAIMACLLDQACALLEGVSGRYRDAGAGGIVHRMRCEAAKKDVHRNEIIRWLRSRLRARLAAP